MLRAIDVWKRLDEKTAVCYRCFEVLNGGGFCVQNKDYYYLPADAKQERYFHSQFVELLCEESPESRSGVYPSLVEAIRAFDEDFEESADQEPTCATTTAKQSKLPKVALHQTTPIVAAKQLDPSPTLVIQHRRRAAAKTERPVVANTAKR
ncbi:MAG: hypothetical protein NTW87_07370 [Planctomycetota bacterium]|nr:hypothetical protein [Planctomycetota bacterium]